MSRAVLLSQLSAGVAQLIVRPLRERIMNPYIQMVVSGVLLFWGIIGCCSLRHDIRMGTTTSGSGRYSRVVPVTRIDAPSRFWTCITINAVSVAGILAIGIWAMIMAWKSLP